MQQTLQLLSDVPPELQHGILPSTVARSAAARTPRQRCTSMARVSVLWTCYPAAPRVPAHCPWREACDRGVVTKVALEAPTWVVSEKNPRNLVVTEVVTGVATSCEWPPEFSPWSIRGKSGNLACHTGGVKGGRRPAERTLDAGLPEVVASHHGGRPAMAGPDRILAAYFNAAPWRQLDR